MKPHQSIEQTVFIIDDDASILKTLPRGLSRRGFDVQSFESASEFLAAYDESQSGCLVLDLSMPEMDGLELQKELQSRGIRIPIIFMTGHGGVPESVKALRAGAIDFLVKPFQPEVLVTRIQEAFLQDQKNRTAEQKIQAMKQRFERLTDRENEVLRCLMADPKKVSSKLIARELGISHRTVEQHRGRILEKTNTSSLPELISVALQAGIKSGESGIF